MAGDPRRARDPDLLDRLDALPRVSFTGMLWRVVHRSRDPQEPSSASGRWDLGRSEVLYTAFEPDGAIAEVEFHLSRQPVFPSRYVAKLWELRATIRDAVDFTDLDALVPLGVEKNRYEDILYNRTQEIGDAAAFLGFNAIFAPSARWPARNATLILSSGTDAHALEVVTSHDIDWQAWRRQHRGAK
jgi:hypothetical protein